MSLSSQGKNGSTDVETPMVYGLDSRGERRRAERIEDEDKKVVRMKMQEDNRITHVMVTTANKTIQKIHFG